MERWKSIAMLFAGVVIAVAGVNAQANDDNQDSDGSGINDPYLQECQQWASYFWQWYETGIVPPGAEEFEFSFDPDDGMDPMLHSIVLFEEIYADKLDPDDSIWDLIEDDSAAYLAFKFHTVSGINIMCTGQESKKKESPDSVPEVTLAKQCDHTQDEMTKAFCEALHATYPLAQLRSDCYVTDSRWAWGKPGFDCDDYAEAMRWFLWHKLSDNYPDINTFVVALHFGRNGHAVTGVNFHGHYWFVAPQIGELYGPFSSWESFVAVLHTFMKAHDMYAWPTAVKQRTSQRWNEPGYWYADLERRQEIAECFGWEHPRLYYPSGYLAGELPPLIDPGELGNDKGGRGTITSFYSGK